MAYRKLNNTELIRYKAISGRMSDYFLDLNCVMTDWRYSLFCWKRFLYDLPQIVHISWIEHLVEINYN